MEPQEYHRTNLMINISYYVRVAVKQYAHNSCTLSSCALLDLYFIFTLVCTCNFGPSVEAAWHTCFMHIINFDK